MARITDMYLFDKAAASGLAIDRKVNIANLPKEIEEGFNMLKEYLEEHGIIPQDTPFLKICPNNQNQAAITIGIETRQIHHGSNCIKPFSIPAGKWAVSYWKGDTTGIDSLYEEMLACIISLNYQTPGHIYEYYLNGTEYGADNLLTRVAIPLLSVTDI